MISSLIVGYGIDFVRLFWLENHIRAFHETTTLLFTYLIQQLYNIIVVPPFPEVDHQIEVMFIDDINLIKDSKNPILTQRPQPPSISGMVILRDFLFRSSLSKDWKGLLMLK